MLKRTIPYALAGCALALATTVEARDTCDRDWHLAGAVQHVLLLSVDGLHALDVSRFIQSHPQSAMAELARHGVTFTNAALPGNSDSFPGLLALVTGGSPASHGVFYDVSYDRTLFEPANTACSGEPGTAAIFDESIDQYTADHVSLNAIDPATLPRRLDRQGHCVPMFPHNYVKANTIFEVVKARGGLTAWADKHPSYDLVNGPSGKGVDDLYTPEITNVDGFDATASVVCTVENDQMKVGAILNQIAGKTHDGRPARGVPTVFGMNFQAVSVGQKLAKDNKNGSCLADVPALGLAGTPGGYVDAEGTPTKVLAYGLEHTDQALQGMLAALKQAGLYQSTLVILTAKHGQSPIDPRKTNKPGHLVDIVAALPDAGSPAAQAIINAGNCASGSCGLVQDDDVAFIWLKDQTQAPSVADYLNAHAKELFIQHVFAGDSLKLRFNDPLHDNRTPDLIVQPEFGTMYTASSKKNAEHGGFSFADINVGLIVSNARISPRILKSAVETSQVAPTILEALGIDSDALSAVRKERTAALPGVGRDTD